MAEQVETVETTERRLAEQVATVETAERRPGWLNVRFFALTGITLAAAAWHVVPPVPNFSPLFAIALFGGAYFANRGAAILLPLAAMFVGDLILCFWHDAGHIGALMPFVYGGFVLTSLLGVLIRRWRGSPIAFTGAITGATLASSVLFFIISNFGAWVAFSFYPKTLDGLIECYIAGIPFFRNTLASNAAFTLLFFGGFALAQRLIASLREQPPLAAVSQRSSP